MMRRGRRAPDERGSASIEAVIGVSAFVLLGSLVIAGGRVAIAQASVESAAAEAARSASIARTQMEADSTAASGAAASLANQGLRCGSSSVVVDTSGFAAPPGAPALVSATVSCAVDLSDVALPGVPGALTITRTMSSPIDTYRER
ncbi:TadE/TadG family type IV pilus assembly protein [Promicromonospora sp. NPDC057488]|uniref:TadE/TadG family type IV pilus assembly protein n=1 Tax=Promicromonospora sp. NPDC057488 TaxID=3346147 RepID=UPI00366FFCCB